ncbi:MAG: ATP synthase F1 subunit delta [Bacteroidales bacterium]|nr:ATP synthase F1 subunit delta [Bacteroidales bacterium]HNW72111.1 ATP synthase F1 subunit delta [Bacteroidales bacterium]HPS49152.1 ATP synthase F1 subunit delta [Bacteroidales bacterium]
MKISLVAKRYAKALFDLSVEKNLVEEVYRDNLLVSETCDQNRELRLLMKSPVIHTDKKLSVIRHIFSGKVQPLTLNYMLIMVRKRRESFLHEISLEIVELYLAYKNILKVYFSSPVHPDDEIRKNVMAIMSRYTRSDIDLKVAIDDSLIGGFVLSWKDKQFDASIRREIENLRSAVAKVNLYKKGF